MYNLWFHSFDSSDWTINGYQLIQSIKTIEQFWVTINNLNLTTGIFFFIKDGYLPVWENTNSIFYTTKIDINNGTDLFIYIAGLLFTENLENDNVYGVSVSPKIKFSIIRLWSTTQIESIKSSKLFNFDNFKIST